jgi:esterase/lipase superfamily enzyme
VSATKEKKAFVFVHGFDVTFEDAARRTAQLAYDLKFQGVPIFYSWPSRGELAGYPADEATIDWVKPHLKQFLEEVAARSNATSIYLIAHSMGNRALTGALQDIATEKRSNPVPHFREVVLAAPDIDADVFRQLAASIETASDRVTLYASSNDKALAASKDFHQYARAGESGPNLVVVKGIDTVDVSAIDTSFLGHSYIADNASVIADIYGLLAGTPAGRRTCLSVANFASVTYWLYGPPGVSGCPVPLPGP